MLSREEKRKMNTQFFSALGTIMQGEFSMRGIKTKWTNYRTGVRNIFVRMEVGSKGASFCIDVQHNDEEIRALVFEQFQELKNVLHAQMQTEMDWYENYQKSDGNNISRIQLRHETGSIFNKESWPELLGFLKQSLLNFDEFWADTFDIFKSIEA